MIAQWIGGAWPVLYEMLFGLPPFYSKNQHEMYEKTLNQPLMIPATASPAARDVLTQCLNKNRQAGWAPRATSTRSASMVSIGVVSLSP